MVNYMQPYKIMIKSYALTLAIHLPSTIEDLCIKHSTICPTLSQTLSAHPKLCRKKEMSTIVFGAIFGEGKATNRELLAITRHILISAAGRNTAIKKRWRVGFAT